MSLCHKSVKSLSDQLDMFKGYMKKIDEAIGREERALIVSKSIYIVCIGSDDIANTYAQTPFRRFQYDIQSYTDFMAHEASKFLQVCLWNTHMNHNIVVKYGHCSHNCSCDAIAKISKIIILRPQLWLHI